MRLLAGPPGSGKTSTILGEIRAALRAGRGGSARLLVPTATLAQHLQNELAREGFVFSPRLVQTLSGFVDECYGALPQVSPATFYLTVERAVRTLALPEFDRVVDFPGFTASLARTIDELSAAGCDSARLAANLPDAPLAEALLAVYRAVESDLGRRGLALRAARIARAAARVAQSGAGALTTIWLDGFHELPAPELELIAALAQKTDVTFALSDFAAKETRSNLERLGFKTERLAPRRIRPAAVLVQAPNVEREAEEIARRILEQAADGRAFRDIGIVVRAREAYEPILRSALARFGIPARFYFDAKLQEHAAVRFLSGAVDAMLSGWDHATTLAALRLAPRFADSTAMDRFDFDVREQIPNAGLEQLRALAGENDGLQALIGSLAALDDWRSAAAGVREWTARFQGLRNLFRPARPEEPTNHEAALMYRSQSAALDAFEQAVAEAAQAVAVSGALEWTAQEFWRAVQAVLRLTPLRVRDGRRNAVQVLSAPEARQWSLPVVFVCGLVEGLFPHFHRPDPFLPEKARQRMNQAGIRLRTAAAFEQEEKTLFEAAVSRASSLAVLTYPEYNARGDSTLPSMYLEDFAAPAEASIAARPRPDAIFLPPRRVAIAAPDLLDKLRERTVKLSPTALESYLQCAFQFFGSKTLRLKTAPKRPEQRLNENYLLQGNIVHDVLKVAYGDPSRVEELFDQEFERRRAELRIPEGYHTERLRNAMREDLLAFVRDDQWPRARFESTAEQPFTFALDSSLEVGGRVDRIDRSDAGNYVVDYKYSGVQRTKARLKDENLLQAPLYFLAARECFGVEPDGVFYIGLKKGVDYVGWSRSGFLGSEPIPEDWLERARVRTLQSAGEIRGGRIDAKPADPDKCRFCDLRDVCRVTAARGGAAAAGAESI